MLPEISGKEWKYFEKSKINKDKRVLERIENFCKYHKGFNDLCTESRIMNVLMIVLEKKEFYLKIK